MYFFENFPSWLGHVLHAVTIELTFEKLSLADGARTRAQNTRARRCEARYSSIRTATNCGSTATGADCTAARV